MAKIPKTQCVAYISSIMIETGRCYGPIEHEALGTYVWSRKTVRVYIITEGNIGNWSQDQLETHNADALSRCRILCNSALEEIEHEVYVFWLIISRKVMQLKMHIWKIQEAQNKDSTCKNLKEFSLNG